MNTNLNVDTQALREKILDLAMRGKLVKQDAGDEPASVLLEKIKAEKAELVKEGKIKKSKKLPEITDEEKPFDIPDSWEWVRLGNVVFNYDGMRIPLSISDRKNREKIYDYYGASGVIDKVDTYLFDKTLLLISEDGANLIARSKPIAFLAKGKYWVNNHAHVVDGVDILLLTFISLVINGMNISDYISGTAQPKLTQANLNRLPIPLPPLAEQKRIADKVSELFKQVDLIKKNVAEYQDLEQAMRSKLLDLAMRGKLVEQDPSEEPASELLKKIQAEKAELVKVGKIKKSKKLPEITDDEKPFDIPDSWEWVRLGDVGDWGAGATPLKSNHEYYNEGTIPWILTGDLNDGHISSANQFITEKALNETSVNIKPMGSVLIAMYGATIGKLGILDIEATTNQACCACVTYSGISNMYLFDYLMFMKPKFIKSGVGGAQPNISRTKIVATPIPIPPLAEQKRIVEKLSQLFEQLETIKQNLTTVS